MKVEPQQEHDWLRQLIGDWSYEMSDATSAGSERVRPLGDLWIVGEAKGRMPDGSDATSIITLGYNPQTRRFVGTWVGSMMTHLWVYDGELDAAGRVLTLSAEGPSMSDGTTTLYQDIITIHDPDRRTLTARVRGDDGSWKELMNMHFQRFK
jgi:uncharacterized protein DUF1579